MIGQRSITLSNDNERFRKRKESKVPLKRHMNLHLDKKAHLFENVCINLRLQCYTGGGGAGVMNIELVKVFTMFSNELIYP